MPARFLKRALEFYVRVYQQPRFGEWIELEAIRANISSAVEASYVYSVVGYVSTALRLNSKIFARVFWIDTLELFYSLAAKASPSIKFPMLDADLDHQEDTPPWDYPERKKYMWIGFLASEYGWAIDYIYDLNLDTALAFIQEILVSRQLESEFRWGMSEIAYPYDKSSKSQKFKPLPRPNWMKERSKPVKKIKILKTHLPVGNVVDVSGMKEYFENNPAGLA